MKFWGSRFQTASLFCCVVAVLVGLTTVAPSSASAQLFKPRETESTRASDRIRELLPETYRGRGAKPANCYPNLSVLPWKVVGWNRVEQINLAKRASSRRQRYDPGEISAIPFLETRLPGLKRCASQISGTFMRGIGIYNKTQNDNSYLDVFGYGGGGLLSGGSGALSMKFTFYQTDERDECRGTRRCDNSAEGWVMATARFWGGSGAGEAWAQSMVREYGEPSAISNNAPTTRGYSDGYTASASRVEAQRIATWYFPGKAVRLTWGLETGNGEFLIIYSQG